MSATAALFSRWKAAKGYTSDREALAALGLSHGAAIHWKNGREASADLIEQMALDLEEDPAKWATLAMAGQTKGEASRAWARMARKLGAAATVAAVALCVVGFAGIDVYSTAYATLFLPMHIMFVLLPALALAVVAWSAAPSHGQTPT